MNTAFNRDESHKMRPSKKHQGLIIAGTHSSVGKSSISLGLMHLLTQKGYSIKPFKVGPDYIDPGHHKQACNQPSYNLDTVLCTPKYVKDLFQDIMTDVDIAIVEGVMGLHDGASAKSQKGSTAEVAKLLNLPVLLVIDGRAMARSSAALVLGYMKLDPDVNLLGVIANNINSARHAQIIKDAIEHHTPAKLLACLPTASEISIPSRHLGLHQGFEQKQDIYPKWAKHIETHIDLKLLLKHFKIKKPSSSASNTRREPKRWRTKPQPESLQIAVAKDEAFQFIYQDTLDFLKHQGFRVAFFSPLHDSHLPKNSDAYYFPGGYPELYTEVLSKNRSIMKDIKKAGFAGKMIVGECGGLMYLGKHLINETGKKITMVGVFDFATTLIAKKLTLGYRKLKPVKISNKNKKLILQGHEFHYSKFLINNERPNWKNHQSDNKLIIKDGYNIRNCHSFYTHIYWASNKEWLNYLMESKS
jgi:cobyrinic acid a,c-diamide synthase